MGRPLPAQGDPLGRGGSECFWSSEEVPAGTDPPRSSNRGPRLSRPHAPLTPPPLFNPAHPLIPVS
eukprot:7411787-Pyramimonas_sp.AAC.2